MQASAVVQGLGSGAGQLGLLATDDWQGLLVGAKVEQPQGEAACVARPGGPVSNSKMTEMLLKPSSRARIRAELLACAILSSPLLHAVTP